ncbi:polysaccharide deacetylase family protein [Caminicella sporogenes]|uniref:polysaccharide deacetylase family protein n=1 Tax=Caminicella sporogenes TaxID=166485 RepID=UPI00254089A0|nr:polysaccharide deacetylase family protein [Caminicella sporogenes]WIF94238.1 polysaccharide deacetylase family protein [Caminicella sporogenes]
MKQSIKKIFLMFILILLLTGCNTKDFEDKEKNNVSKGETVNKEVYEEKSVLNQNGDEKNNDEGVKENDKNVEVDFEKVKPNEAGQVMILMYHSLGEEKNNYIRSIENFKEDLKLLYEKGYRLVSLKDFINNNIDIEAGKTPVVLTFDDGNKTDFRIIKENGNKKVDPNCAVGILQDFNKEHPDFGLEATFFINGGSNTFGQKDLLEYKLKYILEKGMDIENHTYNHINLGKASVNDIQKTLAKNVEFIKKYLPDYEMSILALPFGVRPKDKEKRKYLYEGSYEGVHYKNIGILAVGWKPEHASIHKDFNPNYIHRVQGYSGKFGIRYWLEYFDKHPEKRYISDGDKDTVTIPESMLNFIDKSKLGSKNLRTYQIKKEEDN